MAPIVAFDGGIGPIIRDYLRDTGQYNEFLSIVKHNRLMFFHPEILDDKLPSMFLPSKLMQSNGERFTTCRGQSLLTSAPSATASHASKEIIKNGARIVKVASVVLLTGAVVLVVIGLYCKLQRVRCDYIEC